MATATTGITKIVLKRVIVTSSIYLSELPTLPTFGKRFDWYV
jgi:hypothetical protein